MERFVFNRWVVLGLGFLGPLVFVLRGESLERAEAPYFWVQGEAGVVDALPLKASDARIEIVGTIAEVEVTQVYANVGETPLEAVYVFPGSTRAAVHGLEMVVGQRRVVATIQKKAEARATYEAAKVEGKTTSLLEQYRPNVFQMNLANILPGEIVEVTLRYTEWLQHEKGAYSFVYPMSVGPRYGAGGTENPFLPGAESGSVDFGLLLNVRAGVSLERVSCGTHDVSIDLLGEDAARVELKGDGYGAGDRDFILTYQVSGDELKSGLLLSESGGEKYFLAMLQPPRWQEGRSRLPREYFFVVDVSGSMSGFPLDTARAMMEALVARLEDEDRFNVLLFAGSASVFSPKPVKATVKNLMAAVEFLYSRGSGGGTELLPAMRAVYAVPRDPGFSRSMVILTDGYVHVEEEAFELVRERLNEANVFACGIGAAVNRYLIEGLAGVGQGEAFFVTKPADIERAANRFSEYASQPLLSQIEVEFRDFEVYDVEPLVLPDLLAERPIALFGKWRGDAGGAILLSGRSGNSEYAKRLEVVEGSALGGSRTLEYVWARQRIRRLSDYNRLWSQDGRIEEVTRLGLKHSLLTKYTSFVAVDEVIGNENGEGLTAVEQPLPLPKGVAMGAGSGMAVPVTPEPEMWALMGCLFVSIVWMLWRRM